jgi:murein DD-endopeptidase MepM/ murein hydrolase activator NlpD
MPQNSISRQTWTIIAKMPRPHNILVLFTATLLGVGILQTPKLSEIAKNIIPEKGTATIEQAVQKAAKEAGAPPTNKIYNDIKRLDGEQKWAFGIVNISTANEDEHFTRLWVATHTPTGWVAEVDYTSDFVDLIKKAPSSVVNDQQKAIFTKDQDPLPKAEAGDNSAFLSLPWTAGQSWNYNGGPHAIVSGSDRAALDFAGGDQKVKAAREGIATTSCSGSQVVIRHADGFQTVYYHLANTRSFNATNIARGEYLGDTGTTTGCGGQATGRHVHFSLQRNGIPQSWHGRDMSGWTFYNGSTPYNGSAVKNGRTVYANAIAGSALLDNDGSYGGPPTLPPPVTGLKTYFIDGFALNTNNYFVKLDGFSIMSSWTRTDSVPDQQFERLSGSAGGQLLKHKSTGGCLNAHYLANNSQMNVWSPCNPADIDQNWTFPDLGNGYFHIKRAGSNSCVDMPYRTNGGRVHMIGCDPNNANQRWRTN